MNLGKSAFDLPELSVNASKVEEVNMTWKKNKASLDTLVRLRVGKGGTNALAN